MTQNEMVQKFYLHQFTAAHQLSGSLSIFRAGTWIPTGVIVGSKKSVGSKGQGLLKDFSWVDQGAVHEPFGDDPLAHKAVFGIHKNHDKMFLFLMGETGF